MAACTFTIPFSGDANIILEKAKNAVEKQNGNFTGDLNAGQFDVSVFGQGIAGEYLVADGHLNIKILDKPFMVPCNAIENFLKSQIS